MLNTRQLTYLLTYIITNERFLYLFIISLLAFPADIGRKPASPARGNRQCIHAGFVGDAYTPANETADLVSMNMAVPV